MVELAVAVLILGLAVIPMWMVFQHSSGTVVVGQNEIISMNLSMGFTGQVRAMNPSLLLDKPETQWTPAPSGIYSLGGPTANQVQLGTWPVDTFSVFYSISDIPEMPGPSKLATLFIRWKNPIGGVRGATFPVVITDD